MKKYLIILSFLFLSSFANVFAQCSYTLELDDSGDNGWTYFSWWPMGTYPNAEIEVTYQDGTTETYTLDDGSSETYSINVSEGDSVTFEYKILNSTNTDENSWLLYSASDTSVNHTDGENGESYTLHCRNTILPVEFISANYDCQTQSLKWITASEKNNDHFSIFTGTLNADGQFVASNDQAIIVEGNGNTSSFSNYDTFIGTSDKYIQLWQTDYDGTEKLLKVIAVSCDNSREQKMELYPNPAQSGQNIIISVPNAEENSTLFVTSISGQTIISNYPVNEDRIELDGYLFSQGIYLITVKSKGNIINKKLIVQ